MNNNDAQKMKLLSRQKEIQYLNQCFDNDTLFQLISTIESIYIKDGNKINSESGFYDKSNSHERFPLQQRVGQVKNQSIAFKYVYLTDIKEYGDFKFSSNMNKNLTIHYLEKFR